MNTKPQLFSDDDYEEIFHLAHNLVVILSDEGTCLKTARESLLGWDDFETVGRSVTDFVFEIDIPKVLELIQGLKAHPGKTKEARLRCNSKSGGYRWIDWRATAKNGRIYAVGLDVTDKVEADAALVIQKIQGSEFQNRFKTFFEQSSFPMQIYAISGEPLAFNRAWEELFATTSEELEGYNVLEDPVLKSSPVWPYLLRAFQGELVEVPAFFYDPALNQKKGRPRWIEAWFSPVKDDHGNPREIAMILRDVSEKVETEQALVRSISERKAVEERYQRISDRFALATKAAKIGMWEWVPGSNHVYWDETTEALYGYTSGTFPQTTDAYGAHLHPDDRELLWSSVSKALETKSSYILDHRAFKLDGSEIWVQASGMALYDENGQAYHMMGTAIDITDRKLAEEEQKFLSKASEFLMGTFDHKQILRDLCEHANSYFSDGCFIDRLGPDGKLERLMVVHRDSEICELIMQLDREFPDRYSEDHPFLSALMTGKTLFNENADQLWDELEKTHGVDYVAALRRVGGKNSINVRLKGHGNVLGMITFFTTKDSKKKISRRHVWLAEELAYRASIAFENALIHQNSHEAIRARDEFLSIASHELKTPLQSLTLQNQMRKRNLDKGILTAFAPQNLAAMIDSDLRHLMRVKRLIDDMLDIARLRAGKLTFHKESFEVCAFAKDVIFRFRPQMDAAGCMLSLYCAQEVTIFADMYRLEQVLVNVLTNAIKYGAGKPIRVSQEITSDKLRIKVKDQGVGIRKEDLERIFERFERAISSNEVSGLGLGLYISRQIMQEHQGSLYVISSPGEGSEFVIELPLLHA
jgi:PAS domain S-box-containing protein